MKTNDFILKWNNISYSVKSGFLKKNINIINDITLGLKQSTILGLIGPNGAGKTTTLHIGAGLIRPVSGTVTCYEIPINQISAKNKIGYLAEIQYPFRHLKLNEWLFMLGQLSGVGKLDLRNRMEIIIEILELRTLYKRHLSTFSKGQLQRASLAQAILHNPDILILDEPMSGLDNYWRHHFKSFLKYFKTSGGAAIFSSHVLTDIEEVADHIVYINNGCVMWESGIAELPDLISQKIPEKDFKFLKVTS